MFPTETMTAAELVARDNRVIAMLSAPRMCAGGCGRTGTRKVSGHHLMCNPCASLATSGQSTPNRDELVIVMKRVILLDLNYTLVGNSVEQKHVRPWTAKIAGET